MVWVATETGETLFVGRDVAVELLALPESAAEIAKPFNPFFAFSSIRFLISVLKILSFSRRFKLCFCRSSLSFLCCLVFFSKFCS